jgi:hypothetical protein
MELRAWIMGRKKKKRHGVWHLSIAHRTRFDAAREGELRRGAMPLWAYGRGRNNNGNLCDFFAKFQK